MADALQVRISELPLASAPHDNDMFEVSQGTASRRMPLAMLKQGVRPDLAMFLTGLVGGAGIIVAGGAPVPSVSLEAAGVLPGTYGDGAHVPEVTVDEFGRVTGIALVPIAPPDLAHLAPLDSPVFEGEPTAPLQLTGTANSSLATTGFVRQELAAFAPLDSPALIGEPTAPTQEEDTNTDALATCAFVQQAIALGASITVGDAPPLAPRPNQLWWHSRFGQLFIFFIDADSQQWVPASPAVSTGVQPGGGNGGNGQTLPPGSVTDFAGATVPEGWYLCDGASKNRLLDAPLFAAIGTLYGDGDSGEGATTFSLPDLRGRVTAMPDGGTERLTSIADEIAATGGEEEHTLSVAEVPSHAHMLLPGQSVMLANAGDNWGATTTTGNYVGAISGSVTPTGFEGGGAAHPNVQPTLLMNKIIKR